MIETTRLVIADRQLKDMPMEELYLSLYPELRGLDPTVGESRDPVFFSVFTKERNEHIGMCCLYNYTGREIEIGVRIFNPQFWNKGYGSEVVGGLCFYAFTVLPQVTAVFAKTPVHNTRATRCYEKCGFTQYLRAVVDDHEMVFLVRGRYSINEH